MNDFFDQVERDLRTVVRRQAHLPWHVRLRLRHTRALVAVLAGLVVAGPALAAAGLLQIGSPVGPRKAQNRFDGAALQRKATLVQLRAADPVGGPAWGIRLIHTTRGLTCPQIGRVDDGTIGVLGQDNAFGNDHRFHPILQNDYIDDFGCSATDAHGHAFVNIANSGQVASANTPYGAHAGYCRIAGDGVPPRVPVCPAGDLRLVFYGLLGPDARRITYLTPSGQRASEPTSGSDGAYLLVFPRTPATCRLYTRMTSASTACADGETSTEGLDPGAITAVTYANGHTCTIPTPTSIASSPLVTELAKLRAIPIGPRRHRAAEAFLRREHARSFRSLYGPENGYCPPVGHLAP